MGSLLSSVALGAVVLACGAAGSARAADGPMRRSGLWEITTHMGADMSSSVQVCVDPAKDRREIFTQFSQRPGQNPGQKQCDAPEVASIPGGYSFHTVCHLEHGRTVDSQGKMTGDFQSAYNVDITTRMTPSPNGMAPMNMTMSARFLGACPADMKPGDVKVGDLKVGGRSIHYR